MMKFVQYQGGVEFAKKAGRIVKPQVLPGKGGGGWRVAELGTLWGHRGIEPSEWERNTSGPVSFPLFGFFFFCLFFSQLFPSNDFFV